MGWRNIYAREHATAFTVAKLKYLNLLGMVQKEIRHSIEHGDKFSDFQKRIQPKLQRWLDSVRRQDPDKLEGAELEKWRQRKDRYRLRRIFETNTRQAYAQHHYQRGMDNSFNTHLIYRIGPSINHRVDHVMLDATVLPKDHPLIYLGDTHFPPNGWNCKCYVRFLSKDDVAKARKHGVVDLESTDPRTGHHTKTKPISETAPVIQWRKFERKDGQIVRVPRNIDPGFEWNAGQINRNTWLKDQAIRKARALELATKELQQLEQLIVSNTAQQAAYKAFVEQRYGKQSSGKDIAIGNIQQALINDRKKRLGSLPDSDLIIMQDKVLNIKNEKHKNFAHTDSSISKKEFLQVPQMLMKPDILVWDNKHSQYILVVYNKRRQLTFLPIEVNRIKSMEGEYWTLRSVYNVESYNEMFKEKWRNKYRYEIINLKKKK